MVTYSEWQQGLSNSQGVDYYPSIIKYQHEIAEDIVTLKQHVLAKRLKLNSSQLSILKPLILAMAQDTYEKSYANDV